METTTTTYLGKMFHGWMPSHIFFAVAANRATAHTKADLLNAISIVQFPPCPDADH